MKAGILRHKITIEQNIPTRDGIGGTVDVWSTFVTRQASIEPLSGREFFNSNQINVKMSHKIKLRYVAGVTRAMRVLFGTRIFEIINPINKDERNIELVLMCDETI